MGPSPDTELQSWCDLLRSLHRPGAPLLLPNAWDVATARPVVAAGFPVVATTSVGVAAALGHKDYECAPAGSAIPGPHAEWLGAVRRAASEDGYGRRTRCAAFSRRSASHASRRRRRSPNWPGWASPG
jgi:2-methylisocitrate lyase-like PEP mutase family enzyme